MAEWVWDKVVHKNDWYIEREEMFNLRKNRLLIFTFTHYFSFKYLSSVLELIPCILSYVLADVNEPKSHKTFSGINLKVIINVGLSILHTPLTLPLSSFSYMFMLGLQLLPLTFWFK